MRPTSTLSMGVSSLPGHTGPLALTVLRRRNQKAVSGCASPTACVSHCGSYQPGDTPAVGMTIPISRMRIIAYGRVMIMVSRRLIMVKRFPLSGVSPTLRSYHLCAAVSTANRSDFWPNHTYAKLALDKPNTFLYSTAIPNAHVCIDCHDVPFRATYASAPLGAFYESSHDLDRGYCARRRC